ncbi:aliphatic sulfonate ABC transporter substrate-binding protein [Mycetocola zhadangensis]|uniref:Aliphatic sulfonate ABC transporter substrate-binding protein n=1 Tax=Mycetocola zhadangensis TaxID=1164595 RepID=A0A3L7J6U8_9MICO|nr:aliphatic sulfonate ABC transporter substrate-binding protein [Mycetocola zhadangensis]RLQ84222.1 aliphatic sulfonate ABC transporter substrate-binding protein [Mycetocola zhadangensis]GGE94997.1 lipoprotein [Mycetocola zhadangensis]
MTNAFAKRGILAAVAVVALALTGCAADSAGGKGSDAAAPEELTPVNFGYIADFNGASLLAVADDQGIWEKHGIEITPSVFTNGPLQIQALGTGDLDFGYIGPGAMWLPASGQAKIVSINTLGSADRVIAQAGIDSLEDLKGKKVAVPEGTSGDMILNLALESVGMSIDDVEKVAMDPSTVVAAFASKQVDAAGIWYPLIDTIEQQVPDLNILAENDDFAETVSFPTAFVSAPKFVEENEETVTKVIAALREANDFRAENMDETVALTAAMLKLEEASVEADSKNVKIMTSAELDELTEDGSVTGWLEGMNAYFVGAGKLPEPVDPATYYTSDLYVGAGK